MKNTLTLITFLLLSNFANAKNSAILEININEFSKNGELVVFTDGNCRYIGKTIVEEPKIKTGFLYNILNISGADTNNWHIKISQKVCGDISSKVNMRVDLPRPPSLVGGGNPNDPIGYKAGTIFEVKSN